MVEIKNNDNSCLPRAIVVGMSHLEKNMYANTPQMSYYQKKYDRLRNNRLNNLCQEKAAESLRKAVGLSANEAGNLVDIPLYEEHLQVGTCVISVSLGNIRVYNGSNKFEHRIFLLHSGPLENGHFDTITKVNGMMNTQYYCDECGKGFKNRTMHNCRVYCKICCRKQCEVKQTITCTDCNKVCRSQECFNNHKKAQVNGRGKNKGVVLPTLCEQFWQCPECGVNLKVEHRKPELHECG